MRRPLRAYVGLETAGALIYRTNSSWTDCSVGRGQIDLAEHRAFVQQSPSPNNGYAVYHCPWELAQQKASGCDSPSVDGWSDGSLPEAGDWYQDMQPCLMSDDASAVERSFSCAL
jgi:hypothetical protein